MLLADFENIGTLWLKTCIFSRLLSSTLHSKNVMQFLSEKRYDLGHGWWIVHGDSFPHFVDRLQTPRVRSSFEKMFRREATQQHWDDGPTPGYVGKRRCTTYQGELTSYQCRPAIVILKLVGHPKCRYDVINLSLVRHLHSHIDRADVWQASHQHWIDVRQRLADVVTSSKWRWAVICRCACRLRLPVGPARAH